MPSSADHVDIDVVAPLSDTQRRQVRELLHEQWRSQVAELVDLSVVRHTETVPRLDRYGAEVRLAVTRRAMVDIEAALRRLDSGSYGRCDGCERRIPFRLLEERPHRRFCPVCQRTAAPERRAVWA